MQSFILNLAIAAIWLLFTQNPSLPAFTIGFLVGFGLLALFRPVLGSGDYIRRTLAFLRFLFVFLWEFLQANFAVAGTVLFRSLDSMHPNFITLDVEGMKPFEILILTYCITLTPGTTSVEILDGFKTLIVHALDAEHPEAVRAQIDRSLKNAILRFTR
jgi:multicomponent Na+:H+ antiporter subunit E